MPQQNELDIFRCQFGRDRVEIWIGTMQHDDIWLFLVDNFLQVVIVGESDVLAGYVHGRGDAVDLDAVDRIHTGNAVLAEAHDDIFEGLQTLAHVFGDGLYAAFDRMIVFCNLEYCFLHSQSVLMISINTFAEFSHENRLMLS